MRRFFILLILSRALFSFEPSTPADLVNLHGDTSAIAADYINVITGDFVYAQCDLKVVGATPLYLDRYYISRENNDESYKWEVIQHHRATLKIPNKIYSDVTPLSATVQESNGIRMPYFKNDDDPACTALVPPKEFFQKGHTYRPGYNPQKNRLEYANGVLTIHYSNGTYRAFRCYSEDDESYVNLRAKYFRLIEERLPNGHLIRYRWNKLNLEEVATINPGGEKVLASASYTYKDKKIKIRTSDDKKLKYIYSKKTYDAQSRLRWIYSSDHPDERLGRKSHQLINRTLPDGRDIQLEYDKKNRVSKIIFPHNIKYKFDYHSKEGLTCVYNPDLSRTYYYYNPQTLRLNEIHYFSDKLIPLKIERFSWSKDGKLLKKEVCEGDKTVLLSTTYDYDDNYNLICQTTTGTITSLHSDHDQYVINYHYDHLHRLIREEHSTGKTTTYNYLTNTHLPTRILTEKEGVILSRVRNTYNHDHILTCEITDAGDDSCIQLIKKITPRTKGPFWGMPEWIELYDTSGLLRKTHLLYDPRGNVEEITVFDSENKQQFSIVTKFNKKSQLIYKQDPMGYTSTYQYDDNGNLITEETPSGLTITREYDKLNRLKLQREKTPAEEQVSRFVYGITQKPTILINPLGGATNHQYNVIGHLVCEVASTHSTFLYTPNALGYRTSITDPNQNTTTIIPNVLGKPLHVRHPDGTEEFFEYNLEGQIVRYTDQNKTQTTYTYDPYGNACKETIQSPNGTFLGDITRHYNAFHLLEETNLNGYTTTYTYNTAGQLQSKTYAQHTTTYTYDTLGRPQLETTEDYTRSFTYDHLDRVIKEEEYSNQKLLTVVETDYDSRSNPTKVTRYPQNTKAISTISYDPFGRPIQKIDPLQNVTTLHYTIQDGNLITTIKYPGSITTQEVHNSLEQLLSYQKLGPQNEIIEDRTYIYDKAGNLILQNSAGHTLAFTYDPCNRKLTETASSTRQTRYTYTPKGQLATLTKPDGVALTYTYNPLGDLQSLSSSAGDIYYTYHRDKLGYLLRCVDHIHHTTTSRRIDAHGHTLQEILGNGITLNYYYDNAGRRNSTVLPNDKTITYTYQGPYLTTLSFNGHTHNCAYDLAANPVQEGLTVRAHDLLCRPTTISNLHFAQHCTYTCRGNIDTLMTDGHTAHYRYDTHDHLIEEPHNTYTYDPLHNRQSKNTTSYIHNALNEVDTFTYDLNGNLLSDGVNTYTYDSLDRLIKANNETYTYDFQNRRLTANTTLFIWDHDHEIGTSHTYRILNPTKQSECGAAAFIMIGDTLVLPIHDLQGNLVKLVTPQGEHLAHHTFTAFGEPLTPLTHVPWGFASKRRDATGLIYFGQRHYDPAQGRFLTPDPIGYADHPNLYTYALNNPLIFFDPHGLSVSGFGVNVGGPPPDPVPSFRFADFDSYPPFGRPQSLYGPNVYQPSQIFELKGFDIPGQKIININGMATPLDEARGHAQYASNLGGGVNITGLYNATNGYRNDVYQCTLGMKYKCTNPEQLLYNEIERYFSKAGPNDTMLIIAHSQGAIIARNTLLYYPNEEHKKRIFVLAIAPGAYIDPKNCGLVKHYRHPNDPIPKLDKYGANKFAGTIFDVGERTSSMRETHHAYQDPVYERYIKNEIHSYLENGRLMK